MTSVQTLMQEKKQTSSDLWNKYLKGYKLKISKKSFTSIYLGIEFPYVKRKSRFNKQTPVCQNRQSVLQRPKQPKPQPTNQPTKKNNRKVLLAFFQFLSPEKNHTLAPLYKQCKYTKITFRTYLFTLSHSVCLNLYLLLKGVYPRNLSYSNC